MVIFRTAEEIDYETLPQDEKDDGIALMVRVSDEVNTADAPVRIVIENVNENAPFFGAMSYDFSIAETATGEVGRV